MQEERELDERAKQSLRSLPAVSGVLERPALRALVSSHGHAAVVASVREVLTDARAAILRGEPADVSDDRIAATLATRGASTLQPVLNAAGVVVHTNLGRAPLAREAIDAVSAVARGYSTLEYDVAAGARGSRHDHAVSLLCELSGAEDAAVVNNNAAAVLLTLSTLASEREVIVSRGELVEIGGGFRVPDVMRQSGARLVEVGTTNRTRAADYESALTEASALLLKVHRSNFALVGFTEETALPELAGIARPRGLPVVFDAGSGCLLPLPVDSAELTVREALARGADVVTFSGDKLLGGPQAGVIVGRRDLVQRIRAHPLMRALRPDKMAIAALAATLRLWRDRPDQVPVWRMLQAEPAHLQVRAERLKDQLQAALGGRGPAQLELAVVETRARIGGGASPLVELDSRALALCGLPANALAARLRRGRPPVIARIEDGAVLLDLIAVEEQDDAPLREALCAALGGWLA